MRALAVTALLVGSADAYSFGLAPSGAGIRAPQLRHASAVRMRPRVGVAPLRMQVDTEEKKKGGFFQEQGINNMATSAAVSVAPQSVLHCTSRLGVGEHDLLLWVRCDLIWCILQDMIPVTAG